MHPVRLSIGMSGFCALLVSVWLFDSDPRRGTFPALLGSGEVAETAHNCGKLPLAILPSRHLSSPAAPRRIIARAGAAPAEPLRGCGAVRGSGTGSGTGGRAAALVNRGRGYPGFLELYHRV